MRKVPFPLLVVDIINVIVRGRQRRIICIYFLSVYLLKRMRVTHPYPILRIQTSGFINHVQAMFSLHSLHPIHPIISYPPSISNAHVSKIG